MERKRKKKRGFAVFARLTLCTTLKSRASPRFKFVDDHAKPGDGRSLGQQRVKIRPVYFPNVTRLRGGRLLWNGQMLGSVSNGIYEKRSLMTLTEVFQDHGKGAPLEKK